MPDTPLDQDEQEILSQLAAAIIPASDTYAVPGADDAQIVRDMLGSAYAGLAADLASFAAFGVEKAETFRHEHPMTAGRLERLVVECYYRDDRVLTSLGLEARPPFPKGFEVDQGDWSLLDPVRAMVPIYRAVD
ncbi:hypothetical protein [uncultured Tateyamaria sp.]|uniref:hypothetical protein n=1 Tax=uncultured Tateyamaria sp. TaxID=455651 RepID=UPI0026383CB3|nr:hypothetical protein [uncultured Tateyamaria sp.]